MAQGSPKAGLIPSCVPVKTTSTERHPTTGPEPGRESGQHLLGRARKSEDPRKRLRFGQSGAPLLQGKASVADYSLRRRAGRDRLPGQNRSRRRHLGPTAGGAPAWHGSGGQRRAIAGNRATCTRIPVARGPGQLPDRWQPLTAGTGRMRCWEGSIHGDSQQLKPTIPQAGGDGRSDTPGPAHILELRAGSAPPSEPPRWWICTGQFAVVVRPQWGSKPGPVDGHPRPAAAERVSTPRQPVKQDGGTSPGGPGNR